MKLVSRAAWGARSRTTSTNITPSRGGTSIHYVGASAINDSHSACAGRVRGIQNHHINGNGWSDIAYSLLVCAHGYVFVGRGVNRRTAANGTNSGNQNWYAVCALLGGSQKPTPEMVQGIRDAVAYLRKSGGAGARVNGHRDHLATSCPGGPLYAMVRDGTFTSGGSTAPGGGSSKPAPKPGTKAPKFPLKSGHWYGPESSNSRNHSGYYSSARPGIRQIRDRLRERGWSVAAGDRYDTKLAGVIRQFQAEKDLAVDGLTGSQTWRALWEEAIT
ncbi:peptidoglycan recognition protein family protein [Nocardiopsis sp. CA-288880]|uniref:peptidoglycan recognition protein family protein n=1 Tax=Nocardiopsis sp. CA-288880 TaxID=3239995 RepID=UPI003D973E66